jgi:conjugative transfer signal peptidase TraF
MPVGLWWIEAAEPRRGDTVLVCLPGDAGAIARERDYVGPGECPGDRAPLLKPVAAVFPDIVTVGTDGIAIDGAPLANSMALPTDTAGRPLTAMPPGRYPVAPDTVWIVAGHDPRSFDSRYFGPVHRSAITATAHPILAWQESDDVRTAGR